MAKQLFTGRKNRVTLKPRKNQQYFEGLFMSDQLKLTWKSPICGNECTLRLLQSMYRYPAILFRKQLNQLLDNLIIGCRVRYEILSF